MGGEGVGRCDIGNAEDQRGQFSRFSRQLRPVEAVTYPTFGAVLARPAAEAAVIRLLQSVREAR